MRSDVFSAALKATAKVALSVAFIGGCSTTGEDTAVSESEIKRAPCADAGTADAKSSCADALATFDVELEKYYAAVDAHYADGGTAEGAPSAPTVAPEAKSCCREELTSAGFNAPHWSSCCSGAFRWGQSVEGDDAEKIAQACTPWGPPVPPPMNRIHRRGQIDTSVQAVVA